MSARTWRRWQRWWTRWKRRRPAWTRRSGTLPTRRSARTSPTRRTSAIRRATTTPCSKACSATCTKSSTRWSCSSPPPRIDLQLEFHDKCAGRLARARACADIEKLRAVTNATIGREACLCDMRSCVPLSSVLLLTLGCAGGPATDSIEQAKKLPYSASRFQVTLDGSISPGYIRKIEGGDLRLGAALRRGDGLFEWASAALDGRGGAHDVRLAAIGPKMQPLTRR